MTYSPFMLNLQPDWNNFIGLHPMLAYIATLWLVGLLYIKIHNHFP